MVSGADLGNEAVPVQALICMVMRTQVRLLAIITFNQENKNTEKWLQIYFFVGIKKGK